MSCVECGQEFGTFCIMVPVFQTSLGDRSQAEQVGYVHLWHLTNPDPDPTA